MSRLLILSCSDRKSHLEGEVPAIERYDGPAFRVLRKFLDRGEPNAPDTYVLSARFGLIHSSKKIPAYDCRMDGERREAINQRVTESFQQIFLAYSYADTFVCAGAAYMDMIQAGLSMPAAPDNVRIASGGIGTKLTCLCHWLGGRSELPIAKSHERATVRGIQITASPDAVWQIARDAAARRDVEALRYHAWFVPVEGQRISTKWLVSQITGLPVGRFHTDDAKRALKCLGIPIDAIR